MAEYPIGVNAFTMMVPLQLVNLYLCLPALLSCNAMLQVPCKQQYPASAKGGTLQVLCSRAPSYGNASSCLTFFPAWRPPCAACVEVADVLAIPLVPLVLTCT